MGTEDKAIQEAKSLVWMSYIGLLFLIPLLVLKDNRFAKFHAKQGLVLSLYGTGWSIVYFLITFTILIIALVDLRISPFGILMSLVFIIEIIPVLIIGIFCLIGIIQSLRGE